MLLFIFTFIDFYDNLLLTRIKLQKCLAAANRLPQPQNRSEVEGNGSVDNSQAIKVMQQFLETLLNLKSKLLTNNDEFMETM